MQYAVSATVTVVCTSDGRSLPRSNCNGNRFWRGSCLLKPSSAVCNPFLPTCTPSAQGQRRVARAADGVRGTLWLKHASALSSHVSRLATRAVLTHGCGTGWKRHVPAFCQIPFRLCYTRACVYTDFISGLSFAPGILCLQSAVKAQLAKLGSAAVSQLPLSKIGEGSAPIAAGGRDEGEADSKRLSEKVCSQMTSSIADRTRACR